MKYPIAKTASPYAATCTMLIPYAFLNPASAPYPISISIALGLLLKLA
jgi:hypothetical protein